MDLSIVLCKAKYNYGLICDGVTYSMDYNGQSNMLVLSSSKATNMIIRGIRIIGDIIGISYVKLSKSEGTVELPVSNRGNSLLVLLNTPFNKISNISFCADIR